MLRAIAPLIVPIAMLSVVACSGRDPVDDQAKNTAGLPAANEPAPDATGSSGRRFAPRMRRVTVAMDGRACGRTCTRPASVSARSASGV